MTGPKEAQADRDRTQKKERRTYLKQYNKRSAQEDAEIRTLEKTIAEGAPAPGTNPLAAIDPPHVAGGPAAAATGVPTSYASARTFDDLPLSGYTLEGLQSSKYTTLTAIQRAALPHALAGRDILGAAKTGSGKTLAFLIPVGVDPERVGWRSSGVGGEWRGV